jgi:hypothetical protein
MEVDVQLSTYGLLLLTQPLHSSEQLTWNFLVTLLETNQKAGFEI